MNRKRLFVIGTLLLIMALVVPTVFGASVRLKGGRNAEPSFNDGGLTLAVAGELSGLGNVDVQIDMVAEADVTSTCTNQGGNAAPGQNPAPATVEGSEVIPADEVKNGNTPFGVVTIAPALIIEGAPDCPNPNWTESIDDLAFTSATISVYQPIGTLVLTIACTFEPSTSDGPVPAGSVECTQTQH